MKEKDICTREFLADNRRFADVVNVGIFDGEQVVLGEDLKEADSFGSLESKGSKSKSYSYRDLVKQLSCGVNIAFIGIENQSSIHYAFPIRSMIYDASVYQKQWKQIQRNHRRAKDVQGDEFLSGFAKTDKIKPVITLVVYYGKAPWDGAVTLHDIIDWSDIPETIRKTVPDYPVYVLDLSHFESAEEFQTDVKLVSSFLRHASDEKELKAVVEKYQDEFVNLPEETYDVISALSNSKELSVIKEVCKTEKGVNMCQAIDDMIRSGERRGEERGLQQGIQQGLQRVIALTKLVIRLENNGMKAEEIAKQCEISVEEVQEILA